MFNKYFYVLKQEKICEKKILISVFLSVIIAISCLAAMGMSAYAYFSCSITSSSNIVKTAVFDVRVTVTDQNGDAVAVTGEKEAVAELKAWETYNVEIEPVGTANTGFVIIKAEGCNTVYYTCQLGEDALANNGKIALLTFTLCPTDDTTVTFTQSWGTSSYYADYVNNGQNAEQYIINNEEVKLIVNGIVNPADYSADETENLTQPQVNYQPEGSTTDNEENGNEYILENIQKAE